MRRLPEGLRLPDVRAAIRSHFSVFMEMVAWPTWHQRSRVPTAMQPADTPATFTNGRRKFDYAGWVERIADEQMSVADLQKALKKELRKRKKRSRLFEERGDGFHIY